jgi:uncharacterized protein YtpQ (UPF0354 family)
MHPVRLALAMVSVVLGLPLFAAAQNLVPPGEFTAEYAVVLGAAEPQAKVDIVRDLELKVSLAERGEFSLYLDNAYHAYRQQPEARRAVIARFVAAALETIRWEDAPIDAARIVPVVKDRHWLAEANKTAQAKGVKDLPAYMVEDLNRELVVLYAEDSPKNIRYLTPKDLAKLSIKNDLRATACANLARLLPKIEYYGGNGYYMIGAGGDYESSLLVLDTVWRDRKFQVKGDVVAAIPARGSLLVTGAEDHAGLAKVRDMAKRIYEKQPYPLTPSLFVYRGGRFVEFEPPAPAVQSAP